MALEVSLKEDYILVDLIDEPDFSDIRRGLARLFYIPEFIDKNDIWVFHEGVINLSHNDLYKLRDIIQETYPKETKANKTALVVQSDEQLSMAEAFVQIGKDLPYEFRIFSSLQDAKVWITA